MTAPTDRPKFLEIKDWKRHQHYKDERPAWIKLYGSLLDDAAFLGMSDAAQLQLVKLWLLASRMGHPLPYDAKLLAGKIGCRSKLRLDEIIAAKFLVPVYEKSRESLDDSSGTKTENREQRAERETTSVVGPGIVGVVMGEPAEYALRITIAANNSITRRWGEQIHPLVHGQSYELADALMAAGVPLPTAVESIGIQCERSKKPTPPKSINWFRDGVLQHHATEQQKAVQAANPPEPQDTFGLHRWAKEQASNA